MATPDVSRTWVIVPAFNEAEVVRSTVRELLEVFAHVVVVDDGSRDGTAQEARRAGARVIRHPINLGQGAALESGVRFALKDPCAEAFVSFDADGQHQVSDALRMLEALASSEANVVFGTRFGDRPSVGIPRAKRLLLSLARRQVNFVSGLRLSDAHNGLRVFDRRMAAAMRFQHRGMAHATEFAQIVGRHGFTYVEVPITVRYTAYSLRKGQSSLNAINILHEMFWRR